MDILDTVGQVRSQLPVALVWNRADIHPPPPLPLSLSPLTVLSGAQEQYSAMRDQYMRCGQAFLIVYSVTSRSSFNEVSRARDLILRVKDADNVPIVIVGNNVRAPC